jgi:hypothetical protein
VQGFPSMHSLIGMRTLGALALTTSYRIAESAGHGAEPCSFFIIYKSTHRMEEVAISPEYLSFADLVSSKMHNEPNGR